MYSTWRIDQLRDELRRRGASLRGKKADLIERLEAYDKNFNFGKPECVENEDPAMICPQNDLYRDINSNTNLPPLNKTEIRHYLSFTNKKWDKSLALYESRHLVTARSHTVNTYTYVKGICRKTMKNMHYEVNIKLSEYGNVEEAHCECPAGSGNNAQCKHVAVVLFGVEHMVQNKLMLLYETCTQKLQTFHAPKQPYTGTPVRAEKMIRKKKDISYEAYPTYKINKANYNSRFKNLILNFPNTSMPLKQLYEPANPYAIETDHKYHSVDPKEKLLKEMRLSQITVEEINSIQVLTKEQRSSSVWHMERGKRITASNFHTICHLKTSTMTSYAKQLLKQQPFQSRATSHGIINEKIALKKYCEQYDLIAEPCGLFISKERPYVGASPDALLGSDTVIEIKCPYVSRFKTISPTTVPYLIESNDGLSLRTTTPYYYQVQGQLFCTGRTFCNLIIYTYKDLKVIYVTRDNNFLKSMLNKIDLFYNNYFKQELFNKYLYYNYESLSK